MHQFWALLYKGLQLRKRHYILTILEIVIPTLIIIFPAIKKFQEISQQCNLPFYGKVGRPTPGTQKLSKWVDERTYPSFKPFDYLSDHAVDDLLFAYTPPNNVTKNLVMDSIALWKHYVNVSYSNATVRKFDSEEKMEKFCLHMRESVDSKTVIGTVFSNFDSITALPASLDYKIRYAHDSISYFHQINDKYRDVQRLEENVYTNSLFLGWQAAVEETFISHKMQGKGIKYKVRMQQFPIPGHREVPSWIKQQDHSLFFLPWCIGYGFLFFMISLTKKVTEEKANGSKELLKMMGMNDGFYWCSTFADYFGVGAIMIIIITIVYKSPLKCYHVYITHSNVFLLLVLLLLFLVNLILFSMAFTTFFNGAIFAVIGIVVVFHIAFLPIAFFCFSDSYEIPTYLRLPLDARLAICLFPPGALLTAFYMVREYEFLEEGIQWSNIIRYGVVHDMTMMTVVGMMVLSCFMCIVIIWYVDAVWPWQYGIPKPFHFPFTKSYWCGYQPKSIEEFRLVDYELNSDFFEDERRDSTPSIVIKNLSKVFRTGRRKKLAINQISLKIYTGQITVILGHNGAGKSTTLNILSGLIPPSSGTAHINGWNILTQSADSRKSLGVCPQHDALYDSLTVEEHLKIYAALKGVRWNNITKESSNILNIMNFQDKRNELAKHLSVGMKRKLSLGIAVIGDSKVLILDEPTSGMDVEARQNVWNALLDLRSGRTVILTTHYMEEAEILGDRVAIMTEGEIQCCGSPSFLKRKFGAGYHLHITKAENFDLDTLTGLLREYAPGSTMELDAENEVNFYLPVNCDASYGEFFDKLESNKDDLGFNSCNITTTTLEDVYLNIANVSDKELKIQENEDLKDRGVLNSEGLYDLNQVPQSRKFTMQLRGLLIKRFHQARRNWSILVAQFILPIMFMAFCLCTISNKPNLATYSYTPLKLNIKSVYGRTDGFYTGNEDQITEYLKNVFEENYISARSTNNPNNYIMEYGNKSFARYERKFLIGTTIENINDSLILTAWYNDEACHSAPMSLLLSHASLLRYVSGTGSIHLTNAPLPGGSVRLTYHPGHMPERITTGILVPLAFAFLSASFVLLPIQERTSKAKLLQFMAGVTAPVYWLSMFIWDWFIQFIVCLLLLIPLALFNFPVFFTHLEPIGILILGTMMYGWASIPFSYLFTFCFKKNTSGFSVLMMITIITGVIVTTVLNALKVLAEQYDVKFRPLDVGIWIFRIFPSFCVSSVFSKLFAIAYNTGICYEVPKKDLDFFCSLKANSGHFVNTCCKDSCKRNCFRQYLEWNYSTCSPDIMMLFVDGIIYFCCVLAMEARAMDKWLSKYKEHQSGYQKPAEREVPLIRVEDSNVIFEEERVFNLQSNDSAHEALMVCNLSKMFQNLCAVDRLTFGIHEGECFGLLGVNGSGKTTTFRMLTGDCIPSDGNATIKNFTLMTDLKKFQSCIGYCPQFDINMDYLTGREVLSLFARLNGFDGKSMENRVDALIKMLNFNEADKQSQFYSGGSKRKLSIGIALIGSPPLIFLDEPTAGVDVVSRKKIWSIISQAKIKTGSAVILATHSMKECEALCDRLGIIVNGRFQCFGSVEQLKSKYSKGYILTIKTKRGARDLQTMGRIKAFVTYNLPGTQLKTEHQDMLQYHVVDPTISLSNLFKLIDGMKSQFDLQDCLISDTSLEEVFLVFARAQSYSA